MIETYYMEEGHESRTKAEIEAALTALASAFWDRGYEINAVSVNPTEYFPPGLPDQFDSDFGRILILRTSHDKKS